MRASANHCSSTIYKEDQSVIERPGEVVIAKIAAVRRPGRSRDIDASVRAAGAASCFSSLSASALVSTRTPGGRLLLPA